jgi:hypothetical protein
MNSETRARLEKAHVEIRQAIRKLQAEKGNGPCATITVLRAAPELGYLYEYPRCRCHVASCFPFPGCFEEGPARICANCALVYDLKA